MEKINSTNGLKQLYKHNTVNDVLKEAVMNSIHAGATKIDISLIYEKGMLVDFKDSNKLESLIIQDNGEGLTNKNIESFLELWTENKSSLGGKGVGRFSFLRIAQQVNIESISSEKKHISFNFVFDIKKDHIKITDTTENSTYTKITLKNLILKHPNTKHKNCYDHLKEKMKLLLFLYAKKSDKDIVINISTNFEHRYTITTKDIKCVKEEEYHSKNINFKMYIFHDDSEDKGIYSWYCANNIIVKKNAIAKNFYNSYIVAITSDWLDSKADFERTILELPETLDLIDPLMENDNPSSDWEDELKKLILKNIRELEPDIKEKNKEKINRLKRDYAYYDFDNLDENDLNLDEEELLSKKRKEDEKKENKLIHLKNSDEEDINEEIIQLSDDVNSRELSKYIFHRDFIINQGIKLLSSKIKEDELHNLFFPKKEKKVSLLNNRIWLLDDKFMTFTHIASDETITSITKGVVTDGRRPDIFLVYNKEEESNDSKDIVLIEFKRGSINYKEKLSAISQVDEYKEILQKNITNINNFYCYIICDFDAEDKDLERNMANMNFIKVYSTKGALYYGYLVGSRTHITFASNSSIFYDAKSRNQTFFDILTKKNR